MNLYRRSTVQASLILVLAGIVVITTAAAQRRKPHKLRAIALLEFTRDPGGATTRLIPITVLDNGSFHDAGIYKAAPEPMVLDSGVVYEVQKTGQVMGYFTVNKATKAADMWTAQGRWQVPRAAPTAQASATPAAGAPAGSADDRPILHRGGSTQSSPDAAASPTPTPNSSTTPGASDDRPVIHRPASDAPAQGTPTPAATPSPTPETAAAPTPDPDDPNRPTLRHRAPGSAKETEAIPPLPTPAPSAAAPAPAPAATKTPVPAPGGPPQILVAVSDAQAVDSRSYEFIWKAGEKEIIETKMRRLALAELARDNANANAGAPLTERSLTNVVIRGFDLDLSNEPVMVLSAEIPPGSALPPSKPGTRTGAKAAAAGKGSSASAAGATAAPRATRYITLIARVDIDGNPQKLAASITDSSRLDVAPRMELIDAVDVDGDGLAELLFREYSFDDKSFVIYGIGRSTVSKLFEGASQPLK